MRVLIWVVLLCQFCSGAQSVRVFVINGRDGHPLPKQTVSVQFLYDKLPKVSTPLTIETDTHGEAHFDVPKPAPEHINIRVILSSEKWHCPCWVMADTQQIVDKGIVQGSASKEPNASIVQASVKPGQILFLARPFTFFERLLYPFVKG